MTVHVPVAIQAAGVTTAAEEFRRAVATLLPAGVNINGAIQGASDYLVAQQTTPNNTVQVASGQLWAPGTLSAAQGPYYVYNDAAVTLTVNPMDPVNPRRDLLVLTIQDTNYGGAINNRALLQIIAGTPAGTPVDPAIPGSSVKLGRVRVPSGTGALAVTSGMIDDLRPRLTNIASNYVFNGDTSTSSSYGDIATVGPSVSLYTGDRVIVMMNCWIANTAGTAALMSYAVSGATTLAATDFYSCRADNTSISTPALIAPLTGLTPGLNTFTAKYRSFSGTSTFWNRSLTIMNWP